MENSNFSLDMRDGKKVTGRHQEERCRSGGGGGKQWKRSPALRAGATSSLPLTANGICSSTRPRAGSSHPRRLSIPNKTRPPRRDVLPLLQHKPAASPSVLSHSQASRENTPTYSCLSTTYHFGLKV